MAYRLATFLVIFGWFILPPLSAAPQVRPSHTFEIIDDSVFIGGFYFTEERIQSFLDEQGRDCEGERCLKDYRDDDTGERSARIIARAAQDFGINPKVILITLQKENSLITHEDPEKWRYRTAMGYGCPDNADCDADFFGFTNQVRLGANLLRVGYDRACGDKISYLRWRVDPRWQRNSVTTVDRRATRLGNCATASLYNYTPHRVDSAWWPAEGQHYYGNYNFVYFHQLWFN